PASSACNSTSSLTWGGFRQSVPRATTSPCCSPGTSTRTQKRPPAKASKCVARQRHSAAGPRLDLPAKRSRADQLTLGKEARGGDLRLGECRVLAGLVAKPCRDGRHLQPHPAERDQSHQLHIGIG